MFMLAMVKWNQNYLLEQPIIELLRFFEPLSLPLLHQFPFIVKRQIICFILRVYNAHTIFDYVTGSKSMDRIKGANRNASITSEWKQ